MAQLLEYNIPNNPLGEVINNIGDNQNTCIACLAQDLPFIQLSKCKHLIYFAIFCKYKIDYSQTLICYQCHNFLKKFELFSKQVETSIAVLHGDLHIQKKKVHNFTQYKLYNFSYTNQENDQTGFTIQEEVESDIKEEGLFTQEEYNITTEIKIENDEEWDDETDIPLAQIKKKKALKKSSDKKRSRKKFDGKIICVTIDEEEMREERERDMKMKSYLKFPFKCEDCILGFDYVKKFNDHMESKHVKKGSSFTCDICKSELKTEASFKAHKRTHFVRYECKQCGERHRCVYSSIKHYAQRHGETLAEFSCKECDFVADTYYAFRYHRQAHKEKEQCKYCRKTFVNKTALKNHLLVVHSKSVRLYSCDRCDKHYRSQSGLLAHEARHTGTSTVYCTQCNVQFCSLGSLRQHLNTHSSHTSDVDKKFVCNDCGARFFKKFTLKEHIDYEHLKITKFQCNKCSKVFKNNSAMKKHILFVHQKKRPPRDKICDHCGRGFTTNSILESHIRTHTGERPLQCKHCVATFAHSAALYTHNKLLHSGL